MTTLTPATPESVGMSAERLRDLTARAETWIRPDLHQSIVMLAARRGQVVLHEAFGKVGPEAVSAATQLDSLFPIASLSKVFTATAAMLLVERGQVSLFHPVADFIPEFQGTYKDQVTLWHLLTHSPGGLRLEEIDAHLVAKEENGFTPSPTPDGQHPLVHAYLEAGYDAPLAHEPGSKVAYSNFAFELLGEVIRRVTGQPLADFARENIFEPLGMTDSGYTLPEEKKARLVKRAPEAPGATYGTWFFEGLDAESVTGCPWGAAGVLSSAWDVGVFAQMFLNGGSYGEARILSPATVAAMRRNQTPGLEDLDRGWTRGAAARGLGWDRPGDKVSLLYANLYGPETFCHSGAGGSMVWIDPTHEIVGVFLSIETRVRPDQQRCWAGDLFANAVTAAVVKE